LTEAVKNDDEELIKETVENVHTAYQKAEAVFG
jgi:hypothetical protein